MNKINNSKKSEQNKKTLNIDIAKIVLSQLPHELNPRTNEDNRERKRLCHTSDSSTLF